MMNILHAALERTSKALASFRFAEVEDTNEFGKALRMEMRELVPELQTLLAVRAKAVHALEAKEEAERNGTAASEAKDSQSTDQPEKNTKPTPDEAILMLSGLFKLLPEYRSLVFGMKKFDVYRLVHTDIQKAHKDASLAGTALTPEDRCKISVLAMYPPSVQVPLLATLKQALREAVMATKQSQTSGAKIGQAWLRLPSDGQLADFNRMTLIQSLSLLLVSTRSTDVE